ncbi:MAG: DUF1848 domain-containing protein [Solobacterium sp.]|nr:DUF1848 domain-containing protein [Solobacterium sp.]
MIINCGSRTDIPAFFSEWFLNRVKEGYVMARNPYDPRKVLKYSLDPSVVDGLVFCTKNPAPLLARIDELADFRQFWFVTITPYGKDIEPNVPDKWQVMDSFRALSKALGSQAVGWRYDPIFIDERYTLSYHFRAFETMCTYLEGCTQQVVISFIDLYEKTKRNFPQVKVVTAEQRHLIGERFAAAAERHGMKVYACHEGDDLQKYGIDTSGCMTKEVLERAWGMDLEVKVNEARAGCRCLLGSDIGAYNTCSHFCRYCYANYDRQLVLANQKRHDPLSPLMIGQVSPDDVIVDMKQQTWQARQLRLDV